MRDHGVSMREMSRIMADTQVDEIEKLLATHRLGGLPVVDDKNQLINIAMGAIFLKGKGYASFFT
jgi:CBS-domain-containing membrane protein